MQLTKSYIAGRHIESAESYENVDPSTGEILGLVARGAEQEIDQAVLSAKSAQRGWQHHTAEQRARLLTGLADLVEANAEELAQMESEDAGKPLSQARTDAAVCARYFRFYGHAIESYYGLSIPGPADLHVYTRREPFGVVGSIVAWNYPMQLLARAVAPAVATGNAIVVKPADETPRTAVRLAALASEAGFPAGVFNVVTGIGAEAGAALAAHPGIAQLGFVGSTAVGRSIAHAAADRVVPTILELGGKSAHLVFHDADLDAAAQAIVKGILQNAGQTCSAGSRLLIDERVHEQLITRVAERFSRVSMGPGKEDPDLGPLVSRKQQSRVAAMVADADGELIVGGAPPDDPELVAGSYFAPTLIAGVDPKSEIAQEEIFGPVLVSTPFAEEVEAIRLANGTPYALMGAVWTRDVSRAHRVAAEIEAGQIYVNSYGAGGGVEFPFGGFRQSGYGREKGVEALDAYTQTKTVIVRL